MNVIYSGEIHKPQLAVNLDEIENLDGKIYSKLEAALMELSQVKEENRYLEEKYQNLLTEFKALKSSAIIKASEAQTPQQIKPLHQMDSRNLGHRKPYGSSTKNQS